jgi:ADP-heptose:LPS heptosyltransferase
VARGAVLAVRLDSDGDVLLAGPAIRALATSSDAVDLLVSPAGAAAGRMLPGVREVLVFDAPWTGYRPPPVSGPAVGLLVAALAGRRYEGAVIFTSFHQSPLPMALLARLAGIRAIAASSVDYPGSLLDVRHHRPDGHEVLAALDLAAAAGGALPSGDEGRLALRPPLPEVSALVPDGGYVVVHPGASVPARALEASHARRIVAELIRRGRAVALTGSTAERELCARAAGPAATAVVDLSGRTTLPELAAVLAGADCVVVGNTGPAHLAAAVQTPVVSLFSPVVPARCWAPYGVPSLVLGNQDEACRDSRARECPLPGHPCLSTVPPAEVADAVDHLVSIAPAVVPVAVPAVVPA